MSTPATTTDGSVTSRNRARTRSELLDAAVGVVLDGNEPTMRAVAARAGVGERTIYRYFDGRDGLRQAVAAHLRPMMGVPLCESVEKLEDYAIALFDRFETNHELTVVFTSSRWTRGELAATRSRNLTAIHKLLESTYPERPASEIASAAATLRTALSGTGWAYQRESCDLTNDEVTANAVWLIRMVREKLEGHPSTHGVR